VKAIAEFMNDLMAGPFFKDATLVSSTQEVSGRTSQFEIRCVAKGMA
jgi:hypothetical protein